MRNLLHANLSRLRRDGTFWFMLVLIFACSAGTMLLWGRNVAESLDHYYFRLSAYMGLYFAIFAALFLNTEYSEGTIRNKLAVGRTRRDIYLAHFLTVLTASLFFAAAWLLGGCTGIPMLGPWRFGLGGLALHVLIAVGSTVAFAAIFTFLGLLLSGRPATVIVVLSWFALLLGASTIENILSEPEFSSGILMTVDGMQMINQEPNPRYVSGALRTFYEFLRDVIPAGQAIQVQNLAVLHPLRALLCDLGVTAAFTLGGLALFARKDLK